MPKMLLNARISIHKIDPKIGIFQGSKWLIP